MGDEDPAESEIVDHKKDEQEPKSIPKSQRELNSGIVEADEGEECEYSGCGKQEEEFEEFDITARGHIPGELIGSCIFGGVEDSIDHDEKEDLYEDEGESSE